MNETLKEGLIKGGYAVVGFIVAYFISFLSSNPAVLGTSTVLIVAILSAVENAFFPSSAISSSTPQA